MRTGPIVAFGPGRATKKSLASCPVEALHALEIALQHAGIVELVVVADAPEQAKETGARRRRQPLLDLRASERGVALDRHAVDSRRSMGDGGAAEARDGQRDR